MLCTVSTVKDSRSGIERFLERNLSSGADHMFVFLEADDDDCYQALVEHPHVTPVLTDERYWGGKRPDDLVHRQLTNANLVNCLVSALAEVDWLVHLDGDECLDIVKEGLLELEPAVRCVRLGVLEAVSTETGGTDPQLFKRKLPPDKLELLAGLGAIDAADNRHYFFGHVIGKCAVRPGLDLKMGIHRPFTRHGTRIEPVKAGQFRMLHYDSVSSEEFVRKWKTHLSGGATRFRPQRAVMVEAISEVLEQDLDDETRSRLLLEIYKRHIEDPVDLLLEHDLLVTPPPDRHGYLPEPFDSATAHRVDRLMELLTEDKELLHPDCGPDSSIEVLRRARRRLDASDDPALVEGIDAALARAAASDL
jgi:hypothetical protein